MKAFRYGTEQIVNRHGDIVWRIYKFYSDDTRGVAVGEISDQDTVELLTQAPAMRRLMIDQKKFGINPRMALRPRNYTKRTLRDYAHAFVDIFRKL